MIPEILKGQPVVMFDEIFRQFHLDHYYEYPQVVKINEFLDEPFSPEMILDFEGWEDINGRLFTNKVWTLEIYNDCFYISEYGKKHQRFVGLESKTLSQFITCCKMAGLKLTWKEKIK